MSFPGAYILGSQFGTFVQSGSLTVYLPHGTTAWGYEEQTDSVGGFIGFVSDEPVASIAVRSEGRAVHLDSFVLGTTTIPEPASSFLVLFPLVLLIIRWNRD